MPLSSGRNWTNFFLTAIPKDYAPLINRDQRSPSLYFPFVFTGGQLINVSGMQGRNAWLSIYIRLSRANRVDSSLSFPSFVHFSSSWMTFRPAARAICPRVSPTRDTVVFNCTPCANDIDIPISITPGQTNQAYLIAIKNISGRVTPLERFRGQSSENFTIARLLYNLLLCTVSIKISGRLLFQFHRPLLSRNVLVSTWMDRMPGPKTGNQY